MNHPSALFTNRTSEQGQSETALSWQQLTGLRMWPCYLLTGLSLCMAGNNYSFWRLNFKWVFSGTKKSWHKELRNIPRPFLLLFGFPVLWLSRAGQCFTSPPKLGTERLLKLQLTPWIKIFPLFASGPRITHSSRFPLWAACKLLIATIALRIYQSLLISCRAWATSCVGFHFCSLGRWQEILSNKMKNCCKALELPTILHVLC